MYDLVYVTDEKILMPNSCYPSHRVLLYVCQVFLKIKKTRTHLEKSDPVSFIFRTHYHRIEITNRYRFIETRSGVTISRGGLAHNLQRIISAMHIDVGRPIMKKSIKICARGMLGAQVTISLQKMERQANQNVDVQRLDDNRQGSWVYSFWTSFCCDMFVLFLF